MTHFAKPAPEDAITALIADTFDVPAASINLATQPGEIPGWDSLGHSVLLTRITRRFGVPMTEDLAMPVRDVGELVRFVAEADGRAGNG